MTLPRFSPALLIALCLLLPPRPCVAQTSGTTGALAGRVLDPSGAVVPGAAVVARDGRGGLRTAVADAAGRFSFEGLAAGKIEITAEGPGFSRRVVEIAVGFVMAFLAAMVVWSVGLLADMIARLQLKPPGAL